MDDQFTATGRFGRASIQATRRSTPSNKIRQAIARYRSANKWVGNGIEGKSVDTRIQAAIRYIEERINRTVPIEEVAIHVSLSPYYFHRLFRQEVGEPFYAYVKRVRMTGAAARLKWTSDSLLEIAMALGYGSNAAFSHAFTSYFGYSPRKFRDDKANWKQFATEHSVNRKIVVREIEPFWCLTRRYYGHYNIVRLHWQDFIERLPTQFSRCGRNSQFVGLVYDDPRITPSDQIRYDCCWMFTDPADPRMVDVDPSFQLLQTRPGRFALLEHEGPPLSRGISYSLILDEWLPNTDYVMTDDPAIEVFRSAPTEISPEELKFLILMPLE